MTTTPKTEYSFSALVIFILMLLFVPTATFVYLIAILFTVRMNAPAVICVCSLFLFLPTVLRFFNHAFLFIKGAPALIFSKEGLVDNINKQAYKWTDIKSIPQDDEEMPNSNKNSIAISLKEPDKFINTYKSPYKKIMLKINNKYLGGAFFIQPSIVKCKRQDLLNNLKAHHEQGNLAN